MDLNDIVNNPEQIKSLISVLQALLPKEQSAEQSPVVAESKIKTKSRGRGRNKTTNSASTNKFLNMPEFHMHQEDKKIDQLLSKNPPVARTRDCSILDVVCRVCGRKEKVSQSLIVDTPSRYKCNNCSTQAG